MDKFYHKVDVYQWSTEF